MKSGTKIIIGLSLVLLILLPILGIIRIVGATSVFSDDFSGGNFNGWTSETMSKGATQSIISGISHFNTPIGANGIYSYVQKDGFTVTPNSIITMTEDIEFVGDIPKGCTQGNGAIFFLDVFDTSNQNNGNFAVSVDGSDKWGIWIGGSTYRYITQTTGTAPAINTWYDVVLTTDDAAQTATLAINGTVVISATKTGQFATETHSLSIQTGITEDWFLDGKAHEIDLDNIKLDISDSLSPTPSPTPSVTPTPTPTTSPAPTATPPPPAGNFPPPKTYAYNQTTGTYSGINWVMYYPQQYSGSPPLILAAPGIGGGYDYPGAYFASYGYAVLGFDIGSLNTDWATALSIYNKTLTTMINWAFSGQFTFAYDTSKVSTYGYSCGGATVISINDIRIAAVVADCPGYVTGASALNNAPILITTGSKDPTCPFSQNGAIYYSELQPIKMIVDKVGAGHDNDAAVEYSLAWFEWIIKGNTDALNFLNSVGTDKTIDIYQMSPSPLQSNPTPTPTPNPTVTPSPTPTSTPTPSPTVTPTPTPAPTSKPLATVVNIVSNATVTAFQLTTGKLLYVTITKNGGTNTIQATIGKTTLTNLTNFKFYVNNAQKTYTYTQTSDSWIITVNTT